MTTLYRIYGEAMTLLYVGITDDYDKRMRQHSEKAWWADVRRIDVNEFASRAEAAAAEVVAIRTEVPRHNRAHNGQQPVRQPIPRARVTSKGRPSRHLVSINEAADYAAVSTKTIRRRITDGSLTGYRMGKRIIRVDLDELDTFFRPIPTVGTWDA